MFGITDAIGQVTTLAYLDSAHPQRITKVTDPFGRFATLTYDALGRLMAVTDAVGMTSSFTYGDGDFIAAMTTPYGTTTFRHEAWLQERQIEATDPAGGTSGWNIGSCTRACRRRWTRATCRPASAPTTPS